MSRETTCTKKQGTTRIRKNKRNTALQAVIFFVICVMAVLFLTIVQYRPVNSVPAWPDASESIAMASCAGKIFAVVNQQRKSRNGNETTSITFNSGEVNAMLAVGLRAYANKKKEPDPQIYAKWDNGKCQAGCSIKFAGMYLNFYARLTPSIDRGKLYIQVTQSRLGKLPLPDKAVEKALNEELNEHIAKDRKLRNALEMITSLQSADNGDLRIEFLRRNSSKMIRSLL